jgi:hypothetical protein
MDTAAIVTIVSHMRGRHFYDVMKAMFENHFIELPATRWSVQIDGESFGRAVMTHQLVLDDVLGHGYETWGWTQKGQARVLHLIGDRDGKLTGIVDGADVKEPVLELETHVEEQTLKTYLTIHVKFENHDYRFEGLLE